MKSGPTLAEPTSRPRARKAAIRPVATVVLPTPEWVPAMTIRGPSVGTRPSSHAGPARPGGPPGAAGRPACHDRRMRIVSLLPSATEIVYALGLGDDLVGVTHECDFPPEARGVRV